MLQMYKSNINLLILLIKFLYCFYNTDYGIETIMIVLLFSLNRTGSVLFNHLVNSTDQIKNRKSSF